jgi:peptidoglycan/LPS O-acetylase OafA/YrhL
MAEYLNIDPTVIRILWILAAIFTGGLVILAYIVLAIVTPENPYAAAGPAWSPDYPSRSAAEAQAARQSRGRGFGAAAIVGVVLIVIGGIALADAALPGWSSAVVLGPAVILALGAALLVASIRRQSEPAAVPSGSAATGAGDAPGATPAAPFPAATYQGTDTQPVDPTALA